MSYPKPVGPYSAYVKTGDFVYFSGQIGLNPSTFHLEEGITQQTQRVCENIQAVAEEAGVEMKDIFKTTIFLASMDDYGKVNDIYGMYFSHKPARSCVEVSKLPLGALVEIEVIAKI